MEGVEEIVFFGLIGVIVITWLIALFKSFRNSIGEGLVLLLLGPVAAVLLMYKSEDLRVRNSCKYHLFSILGLFAIAMAWGVISS